MIGWSKGFVTSVRLRLRLSSSALGDSAYCVRVSTDGFRGGLFQQTCGAKHLSRVDPHLPGGLGGNAGRFGGLPPPRYSLGEADV